MRISICVIAFMFIIVANSFADVPPSQRAEIEHLLDFVRNSDCVIDRNGSRHQGIKAVEHIRRKYDHFRNKIRDTEDFIDYSASRSLVSGKPYIVHCPGMQEMPAGQWLLKELESFRSGRRTKSR